MTKGKLRTFKIVPGVTLAALGAYTSSVLTDTAQWSPQLNSLILCWLGVLNLIAFGALGMALVHESVGDLRLEVEALRWVQPVPLAAAPLAVGGGTIYGSALDERTQPVAQIRRAGRRRRGRRTEEGPQRPLTLVPITEDVPIPKLNGSTLN